MWMNKRKHINKNPSFIIIKIWHLSSRKSKETVEIGASLNYIRGKNLLY